MPSTLSDSTVVADTSTPAPAWLIVLRGGVRTIYWNPGYYLDRFEKHLRGERGNVIGFYIGVVQKIAVLRSDPFRHVSGGYLLYLRANAKDYFRNAVNADCHLRIYCRDTQIIIVHDLHLDYLTSRSMLFRRSLASRLSFRSIATSIGLAIPSEWVDIYDPPDVQSLLLLLEWLYFGATEGIQAALGDGLVGVHNILMTIAFLDLTIDEPDAMAMTQAFQAGIDHRAVDSPTQADEEYFSSIDQIL
ncbi:hypothetical protein R3P38DRAFT_3204190 [Favolaschia claudopus]|uniref:BTB domain-containing protein n=1 Tax=Favolaschia claudopus TaxID=2862362 RepID=A0AAW0ARM3_9AGAR